MIKGGCYRKLWPSYGTKVTYDAVSVLMHNWVAQRPFFKSAVRVVKMVLNTQCYQYLWLTMWFHAKKSKETLKKSKSLILQCKFGSRAQKWPKIAKKKRSTQFPRFTQFLCYAIHVFDIRIVGSMKLDQNTTLSACFYIIKCALGFNFDQHSISVSQWINEISKLSVNCERIKKFKKEGLRGGWSVEQ